tara:strand:+ start:266 stop:1336 length:1071 start_codon:yes stop_codon:yes gene_type:complete
MSDNSFGELFRVTTWGESHGPAIGCVIDGTPPGIGLDEDSIQVWLDRRRPAQSRFTSQRREDDAVHILSGVFEGLTTGTPISLRIENMDSRGRDYESIKDKFRPSHADYTYMQKYGLRDYRGGGRASARETAMRVAAGAVARLVLGSNVVVRGALVQIGPHPVDRERWDWEEIHRNEFWCPDAQMAEVWASFMDDTRKSGTSVGAIVELVATGVPAGLGAPIYGKLDAELAGAMMGINAVKAVEIGLGFESVLLNAQQNADEMRIDGEMIQFLSNNSGGILGGISTGQEIVLRFAVKPTSSVPTPLRTVNTMGEEVDIATLGRHDPCVGIRAVPVGEAMMACVLADHYLRHRAQCG